MTIRIAAVIAMLGFCGCATTKAYQREKLADPVMALDGDEDREALRMHMLGTREGAIGGFGHGGGGCGCN